CTGSGDSPADPGGGSSVASGSGGAAAAGGQTPAGSGAGGDGAAGGIPEGSGVAGTGGSGGSGGAGGAAGTGGSVGIGGAGGGAGAGCVGLGGITYTLATVPTPTAEQQSAYDMITSAMDEAISYYNCHTSIEKALRVSYEPSVATADGNV